MSEYDTGFADGMSSYMVAEHTADTLANGIAWAFGAPARRRAKEEADRAASNEYYEGLIEERRVQAQWSGLQRELRSARRFEKEAQADLEKSQAELKRANQEITRLRESAGQLIQDKVKLAGENTKLRHAATLERIQSLRESGEDAAYLTYIEVLETITSTVVNKRFDPEAFAGDAA